MDLKLHHYLHAGYSFIWIESSEYERVLDYILEDEELKIHEKYVWDIADGMRSVDGSENFMQSDTTDPLFPIQFISEKKSSIVIVLNFYRFLGPHASPEIPQAMLNSLPKLKSNASHIIVVSPIVTLPPELEKYFVIINLPLPDEEMLTDICKTILKDNISRSSQKRLIDIVEIPEDIGTSGLGLTKYEMEGAVSLSLAVTSEKDGEPKLDSAIVRSQKSQIVKRNSNLEFSNFKEGFSSLGGLDNLKEFALKTANSDLARGILLLGVPGTGKSHFAKALGNEIGRSTLSLNFGRLFGSLVGESERRTREALAIADIMSPCILFCDEIEKGLSGIQSSARTDGGTGSRVFGTFLTWLSDHTSKVFVIATCNDISMIPPEFLRAERWDAIFFVDLPNEEERNKIVDIYSDVFGISERPSFNIDGWTGAEIKSLYRIAKMMNASLNEAKKYVIPLSKSMKEKIDSLRKWAHSRCVMASKSTSTSTSSVRTLKL